jgi:hypothetical protein
MSEKESQNEDLNAFEAELASLRPRTDRLDPRCRSRLAEKLPSPFGRGAGGEGLGDDALTLTLSQWARGRTEVCDNPAGHEFLCIHCGSAAPKTGRARRLAWPAAFSTMTAVAALLFVMLATRPAPQSAAVVDEQAKPASLEMEQMQGYWLAAQNSSRPLDVFGENESPYLSLRNQVVRYGVESWKSPVSAVATEVRAAEAPLSYREQLDRLLKETNHAG